GAQALPPLGRRADGPRTGVRRHRLRRRRRGARRRRGRRGDADRDAGQGRRGVPGGLDDGQDPAEGRDLDRRQVRRAAVRLQEPAHGRHRGLRHRLRQGRGRQARRQAEVHRGDLRQPHPVHPGRDRRPDPLDDDDQPRARAGDRVHRPVLHRPRPDPPEEGRGHHGRAGPRGQAGLHRARVDLRGHAEGAGPRGEAAPGGHLLRVPGAHPERRRGRRQHGRRDPHRHDHPGRHPGARRGRGADHGAVRRRLQEGRHPVHGVPERRAGGVQVRRALEGLLRQVARPVHGRGAGAPDRDARGRAEGRRGGREEL
ncbi:MAG: ABC transporter, substrate-binding protein (cluster 3, basic aa/glutamine/opines), partial [uncultured Solirubrobacteraceae bacterium]